MYELIGVLRQMICFVWVQLNIIIHTVINPRKIILFYNTEKINRRSESRTILKTDLFYKFK